jgi:hypothetical protein
MTGSAVDTHMDQVFFGWRQDGGLGPVASSYPNNDDTRRWHQRLQRRLRLQPVPNGEPLPSAAFSYLCFGDGSAAFIRRVSAGVSEGRNNSLALIGSAHVLDIDAAIGLSMMPNWLDDPRQNGPIGRIPTAMVQQSGADPRGLLSVVQAHEQHVAAVLAGLIARPTAALSVVGGVERECLAIIWALHEVAGRYLPQRFAGRPNWSFSTYEDQHDTAAGELPGIVFLPAAQPGAGTIKRMIIDLRQPQVGAAEMALARKVIHYLINNLPTDPSIDDTPALPAAIWAEPGLRTGEVPMPAQRPAPAPAAAPVERTPVSALLDSDDARSFVQELGVLEDVAAQRGEVMYRHLSHAMLNDLARFIREVIPDELSRQLLRVVYGRSPDRELTDPAAEKHAVKMIRRGESDELAGLLAASASSLRPIREAAFDRVVDRAGKSANRSNGFPARQWRRGRNHRHFRWAAIAAVLAVLGIVFLSGYLFGRAGERAAPVAIRTVASQVPATNKTTAITTPAAPAQNTQPADQNQNAGGPRAVDVSTDLDRDPGREVWMFRREGDGDYVVDRCDSVKHSQYSWTCRRPQGDSSVHLWAISVTGRDGQQLGGEKGTRAPADDSRHALAQIP